MNIHPQATKQAAKDSIDAGSPRIFPISSRESESIPANKGEEERFAIMQPYFLPYIGYFQLLAAVDRFVLYDDVKYTKKGWINRNRFLDQNGEPIYLTVNLAAAPDHSLIRERQVSPVFHQNRRRSIERLSHAYRKAPHREAGMDLVQRCLLCKEENLFAFLHHSIKEVAKLLKIDTPLSVSSELVPGNDLRREKRIWAIGQSLGISEYWNPIGGTELYDPSEFAKHGFRLRFLESDLPTYDQGGTPFLPNLSILDVIMWTGVEGTRSMLSAYSLK